jgi:hypothetical protein
MPADIPQDRVNHPAYYGGADNPYEAIKVIEAWDLGFCLGNAVKYISRAGRKDPATTVEDLEKARWYLDREIASLRGTQGPILASAALSDEDVENIKAHFAAEAKQKPILLMTPPGEDA